MGLTQDFYGGWGRGGETVQLSASAWPVTQRVLMSGGQEIPVNPKHGGDSAGPSETHGRSTLLPTAGTSGAWNRWVPQIRRT